MLWVNEFQVNVIGRLEQVTWYSIDGFRSTNECNDGNGQGITGQFRSHFFVGSQLDLHNLPTWKCAVTCAWSTTSTGNWAACSLGWTWCPCWWSATWRSTCGSTSRWRSASRPAGTGSARRWWAPPAERSRCAARPASAECHLAVVWCDSRSTTECSPAAMKDPSRPARQSAGARPLIPLWTSNVTLLMTSLVCKFMQIYANFSNFSNFYKFFKFL